MPPTFAGGNCETLSKLFSAVKSLGTYRVFERSVRLCYHFTLRVRVSELTAYSREVCFFVRAGPLIVRKS